MPAMDHGMLMETLRYAGTGSVLGLAGGLTPGPLTALVMTQTLQHGTREGVKVALVPVFTDGPLVAASAFLVVSLEGADTTLGVLGLVGAAFLLWLAWDTLGRGTARCGGGRRPPRRPGRRPRRLAPS